MVKDGTYYLKMTVDLSSLGVNSTDTDEDIPESITMTTAMDAKNQRIYMDFGYWAALIRLLLLMASNG